MRLWVKTVKENRTVKQLTYEKDERLTYSHFFKYMAEICPELDAPTPVILKPHIMDFAKFKHVKFKQKDFVEQIDFDYLWVENVDI